MATGTIQKMGISMDLLYSGNAGDGTISLNASVLGYKFLIISCLHNGGAEDSYFHAVVPVDVIKVGQANYQFCSFSLDASHSEYVKMSFPQNNQIQFIARSVNWSAPRMARVYGVK